ncbi:putative argonaute-like protein [Chiua virens]|nr:putative argonaute-like protein [Chiua virens]
MNDSMNTSGRGTTGRDTSEQVPDIGTLSISASVADRDRSRNDEKVRLNTPTRGCDSVPPESSIADVLERAAFPNMGQRVRELPIGSSCPSDPNLGQNALRDFGLPVHPHPPSPGIRGCPVKLRTNHLQVQYIPNVIYEYCASITPPPVSRNVRYSIYQLAEQTAAWREAGMVGAVAHDGASRLVSSQRLPDVLEIQVSYQQEGTPAPQHGARVFILSIKLVQTLDANTLTRYIEGPPELQNFNISPVVSALNLVQLAARGDIGVVSVGRSRFFLALHAGTDLGDGLEARKGFVTSLLPTRGHLTIKVNVGTTAFYSPGNLAASMLASQDPMLAPRSRLMQNVKVRTTHTQSRHVFRVRDLAAQDSDTRMINTPDFGQVTISHYITLRFGIQLSFPHLPLVETHSSAILPPELCEILPGQPFRGVLHDSHAAAMTNLACVYPNTGGQVIRQLAQQPVGPVLSSFGMNIGTDLLQVTGRVLPKPAIIYSSNTAYVDDRPRPQWSLREAHFIVGGRLDQWTVLVIKDNSPPEFAGVTDPELQEAVVAFRDMCNSRGVTVTGDPTYTAVQLPPRTPTDPIREAALAAIKTAFKDEKKPQLVMVALANRDKMVYDGLKYLFDVLLDLPSICFLSSKFRHGAPSRAQYLSNLSLKLNVKLGGVNHRLDAETVAWLNVRPTMIVGMDVVHPGPDSAMGTPTIAAVVANVDEHFAQYPASLSLQQSRGEMIFDLKMMMIERLKFYQNRNDGELPERILVYRNGISDSQISCLLSTEVPAMKEAFQTFNTSSTPYSPKMTIVICSKNRRTGTWFGVDGATDGNPEAGTVVDSDVTSANKFEFYLQAHGTAKGTARPTLYTVIYDEIGVTADEIQGATHALCYMYAPATHAVSLVAPAYYADLASKRGRCYLRGHFYGHIMEGSDDQQAVWEDARRIGDIPGSAVSSTMFYI